MGVRDFVGIRGGASTKIRWTVLERCKGSTRTSGNDQPDQRDRPVAHSSFRIGLFFEELDDVGADDDFRQREEDHV